MNATGKRALVTGSSQGIGQTIAQRLAEERCDLIINYHSHPETAEGTAEGIRKLGRKAVLVQADLSTTEGTRELVLNRVAPGAIEMPINKDLLNGPEKLKPLLDNIPLKRSGETTDVAVVVAFLASTDADYTTGTTIFVDGGLTWNYSEQ
jgi:glucose 1-dehydrogenase